MADAHEIIDMIDTCTIILAWSQEAVVRIDLAILALETRLALAGVGVEEGVANTTVLAGVGFAKVNLVFAAGAIVSFFAFAYVFVKPVLTGSPVEAGLRGAFVHIRLAPRTIKPAGTLAFISCHNIDAVAPVFTGVAGTFVNVDFAVATCVSWMTTTLIVVDAVDTFAIDARIVDTIVFVDFTIFTMSSRKAFANISSNPIDTASLMLAWLGRTLIDRPLGVFTSVSSKANATITNVRIVPVCSTSSSIQTRIVISTIINHFFASFPGKAYGTSTPETVDEICADPTVSTRIGTTFIDVCLAISSSETGHTNTAKSSTLVNASTLILAWVGLTFVDVHFATTAFKARRTVAAVGARHVHASASMFARRSFFTFVDIIVTFWSRIATWTATSIGPIDNAGFANRPDIARIGCACIVQVTEQASFVWRAFAGVTPYPVVASTSV